MLMSEEGKAEEIKEREMIIYLKNMIVYLKNRPADSILTLKKEH